MLIDANKIDNRIITILCRRSVWLASAYGIFRYLLDLLLEFGFHLLILVPMVGWAGLKEFWDWCVSLSVGMWSDIYGLYRCAKAPFRGETRKDV